MDLRIALIRNADYTGPEYSGHCFSPAILLGIHMANLLTNKLKVQVSFIYRLYSVCSCCAQFIKPEAVNNSSFLKNLMEEKK